MRRIRLFGWSKGQMQTEAALVAVGIGFALLSLTAAASAEADARSVRPSVEELAIPPSQITVEKPGDSDTREAVCLMIESAASAQGLPLEFFARVIWQESRFQSDAVGGSL
jgi:soluble lytic murein transglycosylase-like protein